MSDETQYRLRLTGWKATAAILAILAIFPGLVMLGMWIG